MCACVCTVQARAVVCVCARCRRVLLCVCVHGAGTCYCVCVCVCVHVYRVIFVRGNFREMLDTVVRMNFCGSNFPGTRTVSHWVQSSIDHNARESRQLVIEDPVNQGHCQWDAVTQVQLRRAVQCN